VDITSREKINKEKSKNIQKTKTKTKTKKKHFKKVNMR